MNYDLVKRANAHNNVISDQNVVIADAKLHFTLWLIQSLQSSKRKMM